MRSIGKLFKLYLQVKRDQFREEREVKRRFYSNAPFRKTDRALKRAYLFSNPYRTSRCFLQKKGAADIHQYGETPLTSLALIAEECGIAPQDHLFELGCGRGRGVFFLSHIYGCKATGIEWISQFVDKAKKVSSARVSFIQGDMTKADLSDASIIYLYGTCLENEVIYQLIGSFKKLKKGSKIITVSYSLLDYSEDGFSLKKTFPVTFPWGETEVYLQEKL